MQGELTIEYWHNMPYKRAEFRKINNKTEGLVKFFLPYEFLKDLEVGKWFVKEDLKEGECLKFCYDF
jgi:hypothetical protein